MTGPAASGPRGAWLAADAVAATTAALVDVPSVTGDETAVLDAVAEWLARAGVPLQRTQVPVAALAEHAAWSTDTTRDTVDGLVARVGSNRGGRRLLVNAHVDVVAPGPGWTVDPFEGTVRDGQVWGRGAVDTKGGLAAAMHVLALLAAQQRVGQDLAGEVVLTPVVGEEDGGSGTLATLVGPASIGPVDAAIVVEPTDLSVGVAAAGALCFRVVVAGRRAHGSVRHLGVSAIDAGIEVVTAIRAFEAGRRATMRHERFAPEAFPVCVGRIDGGDDRCDEAAWLHLEGRIGVAPHESVDQVRAAFTRAVTQLDDPWLAANPPTVHWIGGQWLPAEVDPTAPIATTATVAFGATIRGMPYGCDLGLLQHVAGVPGVVVGPGAIAGAHVPDEHVAVADLGTFANGLADLVQRWCAGPRPT